MITLLLIKLYKFLAGSAPIITVKIAAFFWLEQTVKQNMKDAFFVKVFLLIFFKYIIRLLQATTAARIKTKFDKVDS